MSATSRARTRVAIVNQKLATVLGLENPVGTRIITGGGRAAIEYEIVGVVGDALFLKLKDEQRPMVYFRTCRIRRHGP